MQIYEWMRAAAVIAFGLVMFALQQSGRLRTRDAFGFFVVVCVLGWLFHLKDKHRQG